MQKEKTTKRIDFTQKTEINPSAFLNPVPAVLVSCTSGGKDDIVTVAWAGTVCSEPPTVSISLRKSRFSHGLISESGRFVINLVSADLVGALDYCGVKSGRETDKFTDLGLSKGKCENFICVEDSPVCIYCEVRKTLELGSHDMFIAEVTKVRVADVLFDRNGRIELKKANLVAYSHGEYFTLGKLLGFFGFSVASEKIRNKRMK